MNKVNLMTKAVAADGDYVWCVDVNNSIDMLLKIDVINMKVIEAYYLDFEVPSGMVYIFKENKALYCVSNTEICMFDISTKQPKFYKNPYPFISIEGIYADKSKIYIVPKYIEQDLVVFDYENKTFEKRNIFKHINNRDKRMIIVGISVENSFYMTIENSGDLVVYNFEENTAKIIKISNTHTLNGIVSNNEYIYITIENSSNIARLNIKNNSISILKSNFVFTGIFRGVDINNILYVINAKNGNMLIKMKDTSEKIAVNTENSVFEPIQDIGSIFTSLIQNKKNTILFPWNSNNIISIDNKEGTLQKHILECSDEIKQLYFNVNLKLHKSIKEEDMNLLSYIKLITEFSQKAEKNDINCVGNEIWTYITEEYLCMQKN